MYSIQCTVYTAHTVHCTVCAVYTVQCTVYTAHTVQSLPVPPHIDTERPDSLPDACLSGSQVPGHPHKARQQLGSQPESSFLLDIVQKCPSIYSIYSIYRISNISFLFREPYKFTFRKQIRGATINHGQPRSPKINQDKLISTKINQDQPRLPKIN